MTHGGSSGSCYQTLVANASTYCDKQDSSEDHGSPHSFSNRLLYFLFAAIILLLLPRPENTHSPWRAPAAPIFKNKAFMRRLLFSEEMCKHHARLPKAATQGTERNVQRVTQNKHSRTNTTTTHAAAADQVEAARCSPLKIFSDARTRRDT